MKVSVEKLPTSEAVLEIDLTWDELEKASDKAYRSLVQKVDVQGFRRGKAPRSLLERRLGKEYIYQQGLDDLISETYRSAVKEHELVPLAQPELEAPVFEIGQPYHFSVKVPIITPVELGDYSSLHFEREEAEVTSEEVEQELESLRNRQVTWHEVERPADYNDRVTVDLKLTIEDKTISDLKNNPFELTRERSGIFIGMDEHIIGMQVGESKEFSFILPDNYIKPELAGKEAHYVVTLYKIEVKEVPELDDELAKQVSNSQYETLEDLRKAISDSIEENKKRRIDNELRDKIINAIAERSQITVHPLLIEDRVERMEHQLSHLLEQQHMSLDQYLMMTRKTREEHRKDLQPGAEEDVKRELILDAVARKEHIEIVPEELNELVQFYAQAGQDLTSEEEARALVVTYRREKAFKRLLELTTDPDPDAETPVEEIEETAIANAEAAALAGELIEAAEPASADTMNTTDTEAKIGDNEEPAVNSPSPADEPIADVVE